MPESVRRFLGIALSRWKALGIFLLARAQEPGTVRHGALPLCTPIGVRLPPEHFEAIGWAGFGLAVMIGILTREDRPPELPKDDWGQG